MKNRKECIPLEHRFSLLIIRILAIYGKSMNQPQLKKIKFEKAYSTQTLRLFYDS